MSNRVVLAVFVGGFVVFLGVALAATQLSAPSKQAARAQASSASSNEEPAEPLPALTVFRKGQPLALSVKRQKPALLHLWATWCGPCVQELPAILAYGREGGVDVIALSVDDEYKSVAAFFGGAEKIPPEVAWDKNIVVEKAMGVNSLPTTFVLDTDSNVRGTLTGAQDWSDPGLRGAVVRVLQ